MANLAQELMEFVFAINKKARVIRLQLTAEDQFGYR